MNKVQEIVYNLLPDNKKSRKSGWIYFNAPCCYHTEKADIKKRGNIIFEGDSIAYNCFNCHTSWGWTPSFHMSKEMITFLKDLNISSEDLHTLKNLVKEYIDNGETTSTVEIKKREYRDLPTNYKPINKSFKEGETSKTFNNVWRYLQYRNPRLLEFGELYWAENQNNFLIPCYEYGKIVGYSLRSLNDDSKSKYIHYIPSGYIFNYDNLELDRKFEICVEGQTDAMALNCVSILHNTIKPDRLKRLLPYATQKEIILLPDRDKAGKKLVEQVLEENLPFSVAFPNWVRTINDAEDAVKYYGRLYTIYSIINSRVKNKDDIKKELLRWFNI